MTAEPTAPNDTLAPSEYLRQVMAEIDADVERRRRDGDLPDGLEEELDRLFLEFSPVGLHGDDDRLTKMLALVDSSATFDLAAPTASQKMVGGQVKRAVAQTVGWYVNFVMGQVGSFAWSVSRALHVVGDQVHELERAVSALQAPDLPAGVAPPAPDGTVWWAPVASTALAGLRGRVLHAECGSGALVARLVADGVDAYGVDPRGELPVPAVEAGADLRDGTVLDHLATVADGELDGLVLSGSVQCLDPRQRTALVELVGRCVAPGGVVVLHSATPARWADAQPVVADLAPGRPLHAETWAALLATQGFEVTSVTSGGSTGQLPPLAGTGAEADAVNAVVATVNERLLGPAEYVLVATRDR